MGPASVFGQSVNVELSAYNLISGGYNASFMFNTPKHWQFGIGIGATPIEGAAKDLVYDIDGNADALDIDLPFIIGLEARYFLKPNHYGWFAEGALGNEIFRLRAGNEVHENSNNFAVVSIGYLYMPGQDKTKGFYLTARLGANFVWNDGPARTLGGVTYDLNPVFPNPDLSLGWRF